jgi:Flp pilus assembly protein TadG
MFGRDDHGRPVKRDVRRPRRRLGRGQGLVEFAIILPVAVMVLLGLVDLARAVYAYNTLAQSARQASRMAVVNQNVTNVTNVAIQSAPTLGLTAANVDVCFKTALSTQTNCASPATDNCAPADRVIGCLALVKTTLAYQPMTPVISLIWSSISLSSTSVATVEYVCPEAPATACP